MELIALALELRGARRKGPERRYLESAAVPARSVAVASLALGVGIALSLAVCGAAVWRRRAGRRRV